MNNEQGPGRKALEEINQLRQDALGTTDCLLAQIKQLEAENAELQAKCVALGRYVSIGRRQKSQYFRAVKWFLANTNIDPKEVPGPVYHTLVHVVTTLAEKAKRAAAEVV